MRLYRLGVAVAALTILASAGSSAQSGPQAVTIQGACAECGATVAAIVTIDGERVNELAGLPYAIARDRSGRIIVNPQVADPPVVFDSTGRYLRQLAPHGYGPGETQSAGWIDVGSDDSIRIIARERMLVFGPDLRFVRGVTFLEPFPFWLLTVGALANDQFLLGFQQCNPQGSCWIAVSYRGPDGRTIRRLNAVPGGFPGVVGVPRDSVGYWHLEALPGGRAGYRLERHGADGQVLGRFEREPPDLAARSQPQHVAEFSGDRLVVVLNKPKARPAAVDGAYCACDVTESLVEVIDTRTWRVITSRTIPSYALRILDDSHIATYRHTPDGFPLLQVWRIARQR